jgi:integrase
MRAARLTDRVFSQQLWSRHKKRLDDISGVTDWTLHDLRRTFATGLNEHGLTQPHIVEALLNHVHKGVAGTYNRALYLKEKTSAISAWEDYLSRTCGFAS